ncbi:MAG TPA: PH domain-containing protein [Pseudolabrys sp.]|jgi:uncharacterized membrane protein YdbT with pleckstrin-like domain|nr:PH domain-containing protein [Pseudolabrys sp.]
MARYIHEILQPDEKIVFTTTIHWMIYLPGVLLWIAAIGIYVFGMQYSPGWSLVALAIGLLAGISTFRAWFRRWTTEIDVTDKRIVFKRGFIRRHTVEMNMDKVESVDVDQSILGRIFDFGDIVVRGTGVGIEPLHNIQAPLKFRNYVTAR